MNLGPLWSEGFSYFTILLGYDVPRECGGRKRHEVMLMMHLLVLRGQGKSKS
jgi:hypothetical protein